MPLPTPPPGFEIETPSSSSSSPAAAAPPTPPPGFELETPSAAAPAAPRLSAPRLAAPAAPTAPPPYDPVRDGLSPTRQAESLIGPVSPPVQTLRDRMQPPDPREEAAIRVRAEASGRVQSWFERNARYAAYGMGGEFAPGVSDTFADAVRSDPFPREDLPLMGADKAAAAERYLHEAYSRPRVEAGAQIPEGWYIPEHLAATWKAKVPAVAKGFLADTLGGFSLGGGGMPGLPYAPPAFNAGAQALQENVGQPLAGATQGLRQSADADLAAARTIEQGLPQTPLAQFATGQVNLAGQMAAASIATALSGNPAVGAATFTGLFSADSAANAYAAAKAQGRGERDALQDAAFGGVKAAILSKIPMAWPGLARETVATQMAGAFLAGTAITTGDAAVDQAWRSMVRGEPFDQAAVERIAEAFLQGGAPAALLHGLHAERQPTQEVRTSEPALPPRAAGEATPPTREGDYAPQPRRKIETEFDLQPIGTLRRLARSRGLDPRGSREELVAALRQDQPQTLDEAPKEATPPASSPEAPAAATAEPTKTNEPAPEAARAVEEEEPGRVPQAVKSYDELRRLGKPALRDQAELWGVTYDAPGTTIPRILDAQERWRLGQMTDRELYHAVKAAGGRASNRQRNIEFLMQQGPEETPAATGKPAPNVTENVTAVETPARNPSEDNESKLNSSSPPAESEPAPAEQQPPATPPSVPDRTPEPQQRVTPAPAEGQSPAAGAEGGLDASTETVKSPARELSLVENQYVLPGTEGAVQEAMNREQVDSVLRRANRKLPREQARALREAAEQRAAEAARHDNDPEAVVGAAYGDFDLPGGGSGFVPEDVAQRIAGRAIAMARAEGTRGRFDPEARRSNKAIAQTVYGEGAKTPIGDDVRAQVRRMARENPAPAEPERGTVEPAPQAQETPTDALPRTPEAAADDQGGDRRPPEPVPAADAGGEPAAGRGGAGEAGGADVRRADERGARDGDSGPAQGAEPRPDGREPVVDGAGRPGDENRPEPGDRVPGRDDGGAGGRRAVADAADADAGRGAGAAPVEAERPAAAERQPKPGPGDNYLAPAGSLKREGSWLDTAKRNVEIIGLVKRLEAEGRRATPDEQKLIAQYTGFGAGEIANKLFPVEYEHGRGGRRTPTDRVNEYAIDKGWRPLYDQLKSTLSDEELRTIRRSTQYAHYTSEGVIRGIWDAAQRMGFTGGRVLEPGMGTGLFMVAAPPDLAARTKYVGVEMDHLTAAIAKHLLPGHNVIRNNYVDQKLPDDFFDAAFGNPPFSGRVKIEADPRYRKQRFALHDYFFAKTIDKVRPGGLLAFVTSRYTMDKLDDAARKYLSDRADLLGAIRLPQTAFKANAGTEVVTDVLFLRKRLPGEAPGGQPWAGTEEVQTPDGPARVNEYFAAHPEMVLGTHALKGSMYKENEYTVLPPEGDIEPAFAKAVQNLPEGVYRPGEKTAAAAATTGEATPAEAAPPRTDFDVAGHKEGGVYLAPDGAIMQVRNGVGVPLPMELKPKEREWLTGYVGLRDKLKAALADQLADRPGWEASRQAAVDAYRAHVKAFGRLMEHTLYTRDVETADGETETRTYRRFRWNRLLSSRVDAEASVVLGLEKLRDGSSVVDDGDFLKGRVLKPREPAEVKTPADALAVSLADRGKLDLDHVAQLLKVKPEEAADALGNLVYEQPGKGLTTADEYLSGDVVGKLDEAKAAAATDPKYQRNVEALLKVQPQPLGTDQVLVRLGANWIPPQVVGRFAGEVLGLEGGVDYRPADNLWSLGAATGRRAREAGGEWGTTDRSPGEILSAVLNNEGITIRRTNADKTTYVDQAATTAVNEIADRMRERFAEWFWTDAGRAREMLDLYNRKYNNLAPRNFDGSKMTFPGLSLRFELHDHQKRAIWRVVQTGNAYLAHAVGAGKTLEMIVSGMEQKRLGLVKKPMYVVPNHMLEQFANEFADAYPASKVLVADEDNFTGDERKRFVAKAALNDWDAVVIKQSSFKKIGVKPETAQRVADDILSELRAALDDTEKDDRTTRKRLEAQIEAVEQRVAKLTGGGGDKDTNLPFEDLGVDYLYVDEAHLYRKLDFSTNRKVKGIDGSGSGYAFDLFAKLRHLAGQRPDRYATLASGTPITNTLAELYTVQRYLDYDGLRADNLHAFDAWANMFGSVASEWERNAIGQYEKVERFAKFVNVPELMSRVRKFMDVLTMDQLGELVKRPDLEGGKPQMRVANPSPDLKAYMNGPLRERLEASKAWKPSKDQPYNPDPVIAIATDGRLAALDLRLVDPQAKNDPNSKLNLMIDQIIDRYHQTKDLTFHTAGKPDTLPGGAQIVFSAVGFGDAMADRGFSPRKWVLKRLSEAGIPSKEVAFMGDFKTDAQKEQLFKDMREGRRRILIGSPKNMGTGVNVQKRLTDLHFLSPPWYPADVEQPHGRILRQGNQNPVARIGWYVTEGTYDSTMWGMIRRKGQAIEQAFRGEGARSVEDISEVSAYTMAEAVASGDNRVIELAELQGKVEKLRRLEQAHHTQQREVAVKVHNLEGYLKDRQRALAKAQKSAEAVEKVDNWWAPEVRVGGRAFDKPTDAGQALLDKLKTTDGSGDGVEVASVGGFPVKAAVFGSASEKPAWRVWADVGGTRADLGTFWTDQIDEQNPTAWGSRMKRSLSTVREQQDEIGRQVADTQADLKKYKPRVGAPFERKAELAEAVASAARLQEEIAQANPAPDPKAAGPAPQAKPDGGPSVVVPDEDGPDVTGLTPEQAEVARRAHRLTEAEMREAMRGMASGEDAPPATGKLDAMEQWARKKLDDMGGTGLRGGIPVDPVNDAKRLALHAVIGAARIGKGAQRFVTWSRAIVKELPELADRGQEYLRRVWAHARRIARMDTADRAAYVMRAFQTGGDTTVKQDIARAVGMVRDRTAAVSRLDALRGQLRAEQRGASRGYYQGVRDVTGLRKELARIVRETLPSELHGRFLENVAQVRTPGQVAYAIAKARRMLVDHDVRAALSDLEDLTGTLKVKVPGQQPQPKAGQEKQPRVLGDVDPAKLRTVDLKTLPLDVRKEVQGHLEEARYLKARLKAAAGDDVPLEAKQAAADAFRRIDGEIRRIVANHLADQEIRVGEALRTREDLADSIVGAVDAPGESGPRTSAPDVRRGQVLRDVFGRNALSMDAILTNMTGEDSDAYRLSIDRVRRAQGDYHAEQRRTHEAFADALDKAGIPAGSKRLHDWLTTRETVSLPDAGDVAMTRDEMLDVVATAADPQTAELLSKGLRWNFEARPREEPFTLSADDLAALRDHLTPGERGMIDAFRTRNAELTPAAVEAKLALTGSAPTPHERYYPRSRNRLQSQEAGLPEGWRGYMDRALENVSSMEARSQDTKLPLKVRGFTSRTFDHLDDTAKLVHLARTVRDVASVWEHPKVAGALARRYGESMNGRIQQFLRDTMMVKAGPPAGRIGRLWQAAARNVARAWLQANPSPMAKNVLGGTVSLLPEFELADWLHGVKHMLSPEAYRRMTEASGTTWYRFHGGLYGHYTPLAGERGVSVGSMTFGEALKAREFGQAVDALPFMEWADSVPLRAAWAAAEHFIDRTRPGLKGDARTRAVVDKFERAVMRTQNGTSSTEVSGFGSAAKANPMLSAYMMFKSDAAKKYSLLATWAKADAATKGKTLAAVVLNAALSAGVGYALKRGAAAAGRAIGGAEEDPDQLSRDRQATAWYAARDLAGIVPLAQGFLDLVRPMVAKGTTNPIDNPVLQSATDVVEGVQKLGKAINDWAQTPQGAKRDKKYAEVLRALGRLASPAATALGIPVPPAINVGRNAVRAAEYTPPDPRERAKRDQEKAKAAVRDSLPTAVRSLVTERSKLQGIDRDQLTPADKQRLARLDAFDAKYRRALRAMETAPDPAAADAVRTYLAGEAERLDAQPVDARAVAAKDKEHAEAKLREGLPPEVRELTAERGRLAAIPVRQRTREERARLYRLEQFEQFYVGQLQRLRLAKQRGDAALEQRAREALLARARAVGQSGS